MFDIPQFVWVFGLIIIFGLGILRLNRFGHVGIKVRGPVLVLRKFKINESQSADPLVDIIGRTSGIIHYLLTIMGLDEETSFKLTNREILFKSSSLFGQLNMIASLPSISSIHCGYSRPIEYIFLGVTFIVGGIWSLFSKEWAGMKFMGGLVVGAIFLVVYWLSKKIGIAIETRGGMILGLIFKRSVIERIPVDIENAQKVIRIINKKVIESQMKSSAIQVSEDIMTQDQKREDFCIICRAPLESGTKFCTNCGAKVK